MEAGPNAAMAFAREGYRKTNISLRDMWDAMTYPGLWRFVAKHPVDFAGRCKSSCQAFNSATLSRAVRVCVPRQWREKAS